MAPWYEKGALKEPRLSGENAITLMGWGNQARAWAANFADSGWKVRVLLRPDSRSQAAAAAQAELLTWESPLPAVPLALLVPDHEIPNALDAVAPRLPENTIVLYAHGFALAEHALEKRHPQFHHVLLAPKAIGSEVRATYCERRPLGGVFSVEKIRPEHRAETEALILRAARALGITVGPFACGVREETVADLFSEQAVLCSVIPETCRLAFEMLRERGVSPELAFFELWHEVGLITRAMVDKGPEAFFHMISPNALIGAEKGRQVLCDGHFRAGLEKLLADIESGAFPREAAATDVARLRDATVARWKDDEFGRTITRMQKLMERQP